MVAQRVQLFTESVIREMTRLANQHGAINLAQGMPDFETPQILKDAACKAIQDGFNQYSITWGAPVLRQAIAEKAKRFNNIDCTADENVTVCCGSTESMMSAMLAVVDPGDEVIIFQPYYENYMPDALLSGAVVKWVHLREPDWSLDLDELRAAFSNKTRAIILCTPNNPTGRVFSRAELTVIAEQCQKWNALAITDEIYEHIIYTNEPHVSIASLPGMADRTITISGLSKAYSVTGWRLGYCIASKEITGAIRRVHDFLSVGSPHPLQVAGAVALGLPQSYYDQILVDYRKRRELFCGHLRNAGFEFRVPDGAYYVMTDVKCFGAKDDVKFVDWLIRDIGVAAVPGSSFYLPRESGKTKVRFMFAKKEETLNAAGERLMKVRERFGKS